MMAKSSHVFLISFASKAPLKIHKHIARYSISTFRLSQRKSINQGIQRQLDSVLIRQHTGIQGMIILLEILMLDLNNSIVP